VGHGQSLWRPDQFPRYTVLKDCIAKINGLEKAAWAADEIIGWIYQLYKAREKGRSGSAVSRRRPTTSPSSTTAAHDVAVINQFFTPRWTVKFLVDDILGRLWLEMHQESERVRQKCDYLVPEPLAEPDAPDEELAESHPVNPVKQTPGHRYIVNDV